MTDHSQITEFVGTAIGDTIGLVIPGIDPSLAPFMKLGEYRSIGIFGGRVAVRHPGTARAELDAVPCSILEPTMYRMQGMR